MRIQINRFWEQAQRRPLPPRLVGARVPPTGSLCACAMPQVRCETDGAGGVVVLCLRCNESHTVDRRSAGTLGIFAALKRTP